MYTMNALLVESISDVTLKTGVMMLNTLYVSNIFT